MCNFLSICLKTHKKNASLNLYHLKLKAQKKLLFHHLSCICLKTHKRKRDRKFKPPAPKTREKLLFHNSYVLSSWEKDNFGTFQKLVY